MTKIRVSLWGSILGGAFVSACVVVGLVVATTQVYAGRAYPWVRVGSTNVGGQTVEEAELTLRGTAERLLARRVFLTLNGQAIGERTFADLGVTLDVRDHAYRASLLGREENLRATVRSWTLGLLGMGIPLEPTVTSASLRSAVHGVLGDRVRESVSASWTVDPQGRLTFVQAVPGVIVDDTRVTPELIRAFSRVATPTLPLRLAKVSPAVDDAAAQAVRPLVERLAHATFTLRLGDRSWVIPPATLRRAIVVLPGTSQPMVTLDRVQLEVYVRDSIASEVDRQPDNARFELTDGRVTIFAPPRDGEHVNPIQTVHALLAAIAAGTAESALAVERSTPSIATTADLERLGIRTLLAAGESDFRGSPRNRIHNIRVGAARFHGALIPPGAEFAFNAQLGPVTKEMGYKPELVILHNVTAPQYGGGLCQVSTTAFRAAILSGLDITERKNHAYPVVYYGTPGFDATIYPNQRTWRDGTDLKFRNDTPGHILMQTSIEGTTLRFAFWGTSDGREVRLNGPTPYGKKPDGSVRATLTQQIYRDGSLVREETFESAYKSPRLFPRAIAVNAEGGETWEQRVQRTTDKDRRAQEEFDRKQREAEAKKRVRPSPTPQPVVKEAE